MTDREKMIDLIINAKKIDPETGSFTEYLADFLLGYGVKLPTPTPQPGKPLTLDQLQEMDGKPVWIVEYPDWGHWELSEDAEDYLCDRDTDLYGFMSDLDGEAGFHELGWLAYPYPPAHIDRSKWEACDHCKKACWNCNHNLFAVKEMTKCDDCVNQSKWEFLAYQNYCPKCGRPLTEEAWVELERRVMR